MLWPASPPNVGKSTVFNTLTGLNQHVGNWAGKTVEQKTGLCQFNGTSMTIIDLPGTYSLTANSQEELIAREFIIMQRPQVVAAIVNAAILERSLYLVAELMALDVPLVIGLNMIDVARQEGLDIHPQVLQAALGIPVIAMTASSNEGVRELAQAVVDAAAKRLDYSPNKPQIRADHRAVLQDVTQIVGDAVPALYPRPWIALKLLEGDPAVSALMRERLPAQSWQRLQDT